jgi:hypothetical protein
MEDSTWYALRDASRLLDHSFHLVRSAVLVLSHLEVIVTRQHPGAARRREVARESLPMLFLACGGQWTERQSRWFPAEALSAARDRLMPIVQRDVASYHRHPAPLPAWYTPQAIEARLAAACDFLHPDVSAAILILRKLGVIECRYASPFDIEIAGASLPLVCHAATGRPDAYDQGMPW